jgi:RNA polymerase sigma factor (TIGR02999 family)
VYNELRRIARHLLRGQPEHTLQPTALVHEAWVKLFRNEEPEFADRAHFLAVLSRVMRQILIDHARTVGAAKRWAGKKRVPWDAMIDVADEGLLHIHVLDIDRALETLSRENSRLSEAIEMHYFGGMTAEEIASVLERPAETVRHDIRVGRAWLRRELTV